MAHFLFPDHTLVGQELNSFVVWPKDMVKILEKDGDVEDSGDLQENPEIEKNGDIERNGHHVERNGHLEKIAVLQTNNKRKPKFVTRDQIKQAGNQLELLKFF